MAADWDWNSILNTAGKVAQVAAPVYGAYQVRRANQRAADIAGSTAQSNIQAITQGNREAAATLQPIAAQAVPALDYMRTVMAQPPTVLTPAQQIELGDRRRMTVDNIAPGMRGSGRFTTAAINDVVNRGRAGMIAENTGRADQAARTLGSAGVGAQTNMASIAAGQGPQIAGQQTMAGDSRANAITGTAESDASTLGTIASFFANMQKDQERDSRYADFKRRAGA